MLNALRSNGEKGLEALSLSKGVGGGQPSRGDGCDGGQQDASHAGTLERGLVATLGGGGGRSRLLVAALASLEPIHNRGQIRRSGDGVYSQRWPVLGRIWGTPGGGTIALLEHL